MNEYTIKLSFGKQHIQVNLESESIIGAIDKALIYWRINLARGEDEITELKATLT